MTEQEKRGLFFKATGQIATRAPASVYQAFCKGLEAGAKAERKACIEDCNSVDIIGADDCIAAIRARAESK